MKIFIAGIGGVFMGGIAQLAQALGHAVRGCDTNIYSPMRELLQEQGIGVEAGYHSAQLGSDPGTVLLGNVLSRGNPLVEYVLDNKINFQSAPAWLSENILGGRDVIAVAGTHGKTTTASIVAWILECAERKPGFLIGGAPGNFPNSARLGEGSEFVIEADEYDTAFFDKRAKFVHYCPRIAVLNNLEFDHSDIYDDLNQIQRQFHHLLRIVPASGSVIVNAESEKLHEVIAMGCWSKVVRFAASEKSVGDAEIQFRARALTADCSEFEIIHCDKVVKVNWNLIGAHNMENALAAVAAAHEVGVEVAAAAQSLSKYIASARRLQVLYKSENLMFYEDFAHHPSAIAATLAALRAKHPRSRIIAAVELRSYTMRMGAHGKSVVAALSQADLAIVAAEKHVEQDGIKYLPYEKIIPEIESVIGENDIIIMMSNGDFRELPKKLAAQLNR